MTVAEDEGILDVAWYLYEFIALAIPIKHVHAPGKCNPAMVRALEEYSAARSGEEDEQAMDPRWEALLKIEKIKYLKRLKNYAHPKRRQSKTRTLKRRTHDKAVAPTLALCPNCGSYYVYHTVCPTCGNYRGKVAVVKETAE